MYRNYNEKTYTEIYDIAVLIFILHFKKNKFNI